MIRVIIADDHDVVRRGLKDMLEDERDIRVVAEARTGREAMDVAIACRCDVMVLDISFPDMNGFEIMDVLRRSRPKLGILVLSVHPEQQFAVRALETGALGYLMKDSAPTELVMAVRAVAKGRKYLSDRINESLADRVILKPEGPLHEKLSAREFRVMCLIATGKSTLQIALALFLSPKTVATYRARLIEKMGMGSIAEITRYALENHLLE